MRIKVNLTGSEKLFPSNNQHILNSYFHKCLGNDNKYHDRKSDYNLSDIHSGKLINKKYIDFSNGGYFIISSLNTEFMDDIITGLYKNTKFYSDIKIKNIEFIEPVFYDGWNHFRTLSPILLKKYESKHKYSFITFKTEGFKNYLEEYLKNKLSKINKDLNLSNFRIEYSEHPNHKVKIVMIKNVKNIASHIQFSVYTNKAVAHHLYNYGIGQSTGSGFGTIYKTENNSKY